MHTDSPPRPLRPLHTLLSLLLIVLQLIGMLPPAIPARAQAAPPASLSEASKKLNEQPLDLQYAVSKELGLHDTSYHLEGDGSSLNAPNPAQGLRTTFDSLGMQISANGYGWGIELAGLGRGTRLDPVAPGIQRQPEANRVEFDHGLLTSWYVNGPLGVQQGWTLREQPQGATDEPLALALLQSGNLQGHLTPDKRGLELVDESGIQRLSYDGLVAFDTNGKHLPVWIELIDACTVAVSRCHSGAEQLLASPPALRIRVDDRGAAYPLTIDPWVQTGELAGWSDSSDNSDITIQLSDDGSTIAVAVPSQSAVFVYTRDEYGAIDPSKTARLVPSNNETDTSHGRAMAMSDDGRTIVVGRRDGKVSVYERPGDSWPNPSTPQAVFGSSYLSMTSTEKTRYGDFISYKGTPNYTGGVAISADGSTIVAGFESLERCRIVNRQQTCFNIGGAILFERPSDHGSWSSWDDNQRKVIGRIDEIINSPTLNSYTTGNYVAINAAGDRVFIDGNASTRYTIIYGFRHYGSWPKIIDPELFDSWSPTYTRSVGGILRPLGGIAIDRDGTMLVASESTNKRIIAWTGISNQAGPRPAFEIDCGGSGVGFGGQLALSGDGHTLMYSTYDDPNYRVNVVTMPTDGWPTDGGTYDLLDQTTQFPARRLGISGDGSTTVAGNNIYIPQLPSLTLDPPQVNAGSGRFTLTLRGSGFSSGTSVGWNGTPLARTRVTTSEIDVVVPADLVDIGGNVTLFVQNPMPNGAAYRTSYTVANAAPVLSELEPATSFAGEPSLHLAARGSGFSAASTIFWNGTPLATTFVNSTTLRADVDAAQIAAPGSAEVSVTTPAPGGGTSITLAHTLLEIPAPQLSGISPFARPAGKPDFTLTAVGSAFSQRSQIVWGGQPLSTTYVNSTTLTTLIPASEIENEGTFTVSVTTGAPGGGSSAPQLFTVTSANPSLVDVDPFFGPPAGGTEVTLRGQNLESTSAVTFGLQAATILTRTETELVVRAPAGLIGSVDLAVTTRYGSVSMRGGYVYANSQPAQPWRDFGRVRVWADTFVTTNDTTTASGRIAIGDGNANARYYRVSDAVSWVTSDTLTLSGTLGFFGGQSLSEGQFDLDTATGAITMRPGALTLVDKLGSSDIAINPRLTINALQAQVPASATLVVSLPENPSVGIDVRYRLNRNGALTPDGNSPLPLKLAGGNLQATINVTTSGLVAPKATLTLPYLPPLTLPALSIGDAGLSFGSSFVLPDVDLGNGVLKLTGLQARLQTASNGYELPLSGTLVLANLPEGISRALPLSNARLVKGMFTGNVAAFDLTMAGAPLAVGGASLAVVSDRYRLNTSGATYSLPAAWGNESRPTVALNNLALTSDAPFLSFSDSTRFNLPNSYSLGNSTSGRNSVSFERIRAQLRVDGGRWALDLTTNLRFRLGTQKGDGGDYNNVLLTIADDSIHGVISDARLLVAGIPLSASLQYRDGQFSAEQATLTLPAKWNRVQANTGGLAITPNELRLGPAVFGPAGGQPTFTIPTISLGVLGFGNNTASLFANNDNAYQLGISSTLALNKVQGLGGVAPQTPAYLAVRAGRISGTVSELAFRLSGFDISARNLQVIDNLVKSDVVTLTLPSRLGKAQVKLYGLEIGGARNFALRGGAFKLPDFKMGTVGVKNVSAEFIAEGDEYVLSAEGRLDFAKFSVEAGFKVAYNAASSSVQVRRLMIAFEGRIPTTAIAIGTTGLYFTRVSGEFSLEDGTLTISLGTRISSMAEIADKPMLSMDASVTFQLRPSFEFRANAELYVIGMRAASAELRIWGSGFSFKGNATFGILRLSLEITFGVDAWNEFTFYGRIAADIVIPKGFISSFLFDIPSADIPIASASLEGGKFSKGDERFWGARGSVTILGIFSLSAMLRLGNSGGISFSKSIWEYQPVRPVGALALAQQAAPRDTFVFTAANPGLELALIETLTTTQRAKPLPLEIRSPRGVPFTASLAYTETDKSYRIYKVTVNKPEDIRGIWTVRPALGNLVVPMGLIPPPEFRRAEACLVGGACLSHNGATLLAAGQALDLNWDARGFTPGLTLDLFATDSKGERSYITTTTTSALTLTGSTRWTPALASGSYTLTAMLTGGEGAPVEQQLGLLAYSDSQAPAAPQNLVGTGQHDLSVLLEWNGTAAEVDVLGYQVAVDGGEPIQTDGRLSSLTSAGLTPGKTYSFAVAAYDRSGNIGAASTVTVTLPLLGLSSNTPSSGSLEINPREISAAFSGIVAGSVLTVTNAAGVAIPGTTTPITSETLLDELPPGTPMLSSDPGSGVGVVEYGAVFVPSEQTLTPGRYTATISAWDPTHSEQVTASWSFEVLNPPHSYHLPIFFR